MLEKIKNIYSSNPKLQLILFLLVIFIAIFGAYWFTTQNTNKYQNLNSVGYKLKPEEKPKEEPKKKKVEKVTRIESAPAPAPKKQPETNEENSAEHQKNLHEIRKKRFDNDIEKQFEFLNKF